MSRPVHGGNLAWAAGLAGCAPAELLDFSASISPLGPPHSACEAVRADFLSVRSYPDPAYGALRGAIARHHKLPIECITPGNGAAELLTWAARDLAQMVGCFCLSPGFSDYDRALGAFDCTPVKLPFFNSTSWENLIFDQPFDLGQCGFLLNNPHNPTGELFSREDIRPFLSKLGLLVVDEAFMDFLPPEREQSVIDWVGEFENLVVIRSLTKFYSMPGLRLGYAIAHPKIIKRWQQWRDPWSVNTLAITAGIAALRDTEFQQRTWDWLEVANAQLYQELSAVTGLSPLAGCANFLLVECQKSVVALQEVLLKRDRIYIRDCMSFEGLGDRYFRVAVKTQAENARLVSAIAQTLPDLPEASDAS